MSDSASTNVTLARADPFTFVPLIVEKTIAAPSSLNARSISTHLSIIAVLRIVLARRAPERLP